RIAVSAVGDDADQLGERTGMIRRAADRGGQRWHQAAERVPQALPELVDLEERLLLEQARDTPILSLAVAGPEQPSVHLLARFGAVREQRAERCFGAPVQRSREPQLERVYPGHEAAV